MNNITGVYKYQRIRDVREDHDLTQKQVAEILNLHLTTYRRYELGQQTIPIYIVKKLAEYYNTTVDYLVEIEEIMK